MLFDRQWLLQYLTWMINLLTALFAGDSDICEGNAEGSACCGSKQAVDGEMIQFLMEEEVESFDLKRYMGRKKGAIEAALDHAISHNDLHPAKRLIESMRYSLLAGGKRMRPILCVAAAEMFGGSEESVLPTAVAIEMIHTMSLIHDDLPAMDDDSLRRGKPTNHVLYGEDVAILAGDALLSTSFEYVASATSGVEPGRVLQVIGRLGRAAGADGLAGGQVKDLECENNHESVSLEDLKWIHVHKTAALLKVSVATGAILAGASSEDVASLEEYAEKIGLAFQIMDDVLDVTATSAELGKTAGKDEDANKATYVRFLGVDKSRSEAARLVDEAKASLKKYGDRAIALKQIADFVVARKS